MSFWKTVGKVAATVGKGALNVASDTLDKTQEDKQEMADKSDAQLIELLTSSRSMSMRVASAATELKRRGYNQEEINATRSSSR